MKPEQLKSLLEKECEVCGGTGWVTGSRFGGFQPATRRCENSRRCPDCVFGKAPSELGEVVLEFVKDHLESWVSEQSKNHTHGRGEQS